MIKKIITSIFAAVTILSLAFYSGQVNAEVKESTSKVTETYTIDVDGEQIQIDKIDSDGIEIYGVKTEIKDKSKYEHVAQSVDEYINKMEKKKAPIGTMAAQCLWNYHPPTGVGIDGDARTFNEASSCRYYGPITNYESVTVKQGGWIEGRWYGSTLPDSIKIGALYEFDGWALTSLDFPTGVGFTKLNGSTVKWTSNTVKGYSYLRTAHQEITAGTHLGNVFGVTITTNAEIYKGANIYRPKVAVKHGI